MTSDLQCQKKNEHLSEALAGFFLFPTNLIFFITLSFYFMESVQFRCSGAEFSSLLEQRLPQRTRSLRSAADCQDFLLFFFFAEDD